MVKKIVKSVVYAWGMLKVRRRLRNERFEKI